MKQVYTYYQFTLAAGALRNIDAYANFITLLDNDTATDVMISIAEQAEQALPKGLSVELPESERFIRLIFRNPSAGPMTIKLSISNGRVFDNRVVFTGSIDVDPVCNGIASPAPFAVTDVAQIAVAADTATRSLLLQNNGGNDIWFGDSNVTPATSRGLKLPPNASVAVETKAAVYARCAAGLTSTLSILRTYEV